MKITIRFKLIFSFMVVSIITLIVGVVGFYGISQLEKSIGFVGKNRIPDLQTLAVLNKERLAD